MAGSITTLGIGSGLDLQDILDQLREAERYSITQKEDEKETLQGKVNAYNSLNAKLFSMKSNALSLSLESNFLKNSGTLSDEDILSATVDDGIQEASYSIEVTQKAQQNSWQTDGVETEEAVIYAEPATTIATADEDVTTIAETMTIQYGAAGEQQAIEISLTADMSLTQIAAAVNESANNQDETGAQLVSASVNQNSDGNYYIRLNATNGGNTAESQISVAGFDYVKHDTTIALSLADGSEPSYVSLAPGTTYIQAANLINEATDNPGITASIIDDGSGATPYRLVLVADETGEDNRITIQNLTLTEVTGAGGSSLNSIFKVNGITYNRQSNTGITDVISGVSLTLKKAGETSLGVGKNTDPIKEDIQSLIDTYNDIVSEINGTGSDDDEEDSEDTTNPLSDSYNVKSIIQKLSNLASTVIDIDSEYTSLIDLGLEINQDGSISIDETLLDQALASDPEGIQSLFIGDEDNEITGLGDVLNDGIAAMVNSSGLVTTEIDAVESQIERLEGDIITATERLDKKFEIMTQQFAQLDSFISQLNSEAAFMNSIFESFNNTTENS